MEPVALRLLNLILAGGESRGSIRKIFKIFKSLKEINESFFHLILPSFCQIINEFGDSGDELFIKEIISYIEAMLDYESSKKPVILIILSHPILVDDLSLVDCMHGKLRKSQK